MRGALRTAAVGLVVAAGIDPAFAIRRPAPIPVELRAESPRAVEMKDRLIAMLGPDVVVAGGEPPAAVVLVGDGAGDVALPPGVPVSTVLSPDARSPNVRLSVVSAPADVLPGQDAVMSATVEAVGLTGQTSRIALEQNGVELAHVDHRWAGDRDQFVTSLRYAPPEAGLLVLRVAVRPLKGERTPDDNAADVGVTVRARPLRIVTFEPRPSWMLTFVRRALEADPAFVVSSFVRSSRGYGVRSGEAPPALTASALRPFDVVAVGAPEELTGPEIDALETFARLRGGAVVLLPDRRPRGPFTTLLASGPFEEVLLEQPGAIESGELSLRASELALSTAVHGGGVPLATIAQADRARPAIVSWPWGAGRVVFSGALDAWRFRDREQTFARFWTGTIASLAAAAPPPVSVRVIPAAAAPGERVAISAAMRATELMRRPEELEVPPIAGTLVAPDGSSRMIRLWPGSAAGLFEGTLPPLAAGRYIVRVTIPSATVESPLIVADGVEHATRQNDDALRLIAAATGGVAAAAGDLSPIVTHVRSLARRDISTEVRPMRSVWWIPVLTGLLSAEWMLRRRAGLS